MWELDFNKDLVDIFAVKKYLSTRCLNASDSLQNAVPLQPNVSNVSEKGKGVEQFLSKIGNDQRAIDPTEMNTLLHNDLPILLDNENIVMAFKAGRDATFFTNLRVLIMDVQGMSGKRVKYKSLPYKSILSFSAASAGSWDRDSEVKLYTRNDWSMKEISMDFRKGKADIVMIQKFFSSVLMGSKEDMESYFQSVGGSFKKSLEMDVPGVDSFLSWVTSNSVEIDAASVTEKLHNDPPVLLDAERCEKAYQAGRDMYVYTTHRFLMVNVQGLTGKKIEYLSIPCKNIEFFSVETAGHLDRDSEVYLNTRVLGKKKVQQDILAKHGDVMDMNVYLTEKLIC